MKDKDSKYKLSVVDSEDDIVELYASADTVLKKFIGSNPLHVLVISVDKDGTLRSGANTSSKAELLFMIEQFRHSLMAGEFDD